MGQNITSWTEQVEAAGIKWGRVQEATEEGQVPCTAVKPTMMMCHLTCCATAHTANYSIKGLQVFEDRLTNHRTDLQYLQTYIYVICICTYIPVICICRET